MWCVFKSQSVSGVSRARHTLGLVEQSDALDENLPGPVHLHSPSLGGLQQSLIFIVLLCEWRTFRVKPVGEQRGVWVMESLGILIYSLLISVLVISHMTETPPSAF